MAGSLKTDLLIGGVFRAPVRIADRGGDNARYEREILLNAPEAPSG